MSQAALAPLNPTTTSGTDLATKLVNYETAVLSGHSGTSRPSYAAAGTFWRDTTTNPNVLYFYDGTSDIPIMRINTSSHRRQDRAVEASIASAATTDVLGANTDRVAISGTASISSLGTEALQIKFVRATGAFTLVHNATTLILPTGANIVAASGDTFIVASDSSGNARIFAYQRASGAALVAAAGDLPSGSVVLFMQAAAPSGWTQVTTHNDKALRLVSSAGAGSGGSLNFSTVFAKTATDSYTLTTTDIPAHTHGPGTLAGVTDNPGNHTHTYNNSNDNNAQASAGTARNTGNNTDDTGGDGAHTHTVTINSGLSASTGSGGGHSHNMDIQVRYVDIIACSKN